MWSDESGPYDGKHYHLAETLCVPRPIQKPHPPILIGGGGEKKVIQPRWLQLPSCWTWPANRAGNRDRRQDRRESDRLS